MSNKIKETKIENLIPDDKNFNKGTQYGQHLIEESLRKFGAGRSILLDKNNRIIAGNKTIENAASLGMEDIVVVETTGDKIVAVKRTDIDLDTQQGREMALADNATGAANLSWDEDTLKQAEGEFGLVPSEWGVVPEFADDVVLEIDDSEDDFSESDPVEKRVSKGDVWQCGKHRLMCGDSTSAECVAKLMNGEQADLCFTDPPYGMKKESEGVLNDNLNYDDLLEFNKRWIPLTFANLKGNGSWYCWGIDEPLMDIYSNILKPMQRRNEITFRNLITWDKGDAGAGGVSFMGKDGLRSYPISDEKCLFMMCGVQGFNNNQDNYFEGWEPVRQYLAGEAEKVGLTPQKLKEICGVGMWSHWFGKSQFAFITEEHYKELQEYYRKNGNDEFKKEYDEIKKEYDEIKKEYYSTRAYFDNTHDKMTDVWHFDRTSKEERDGIDHATPKPIALCARGIKTSSREGEIVLDVFGGSGTTMIAAERLNRKCYMMELDPHYCDIIIARWEKETGKKAVKVG